MKGSWAVFEVEFKGSGAPLVFECFVRMRLAELRKVGVYEVLAGIFCSQSVRVTRSHWIIGAAIVYCS